MLKVASSEGEKEEIYSLSSDQLLPECIISGESGLKNEGSIAESEKCCSVWSEGAKDANNFRSSVSSLLQLQSTTGEPNHRFSAGLLSTSTNPNSLNSCEDFVSSSRNHPTLCQGFSSKAKWSLLKNATANPDVTNGQVSSKETLLVGVFDSEFTIQWSAPVEAVAHFPPDHLKITRLVQCRNYRAYEADSCKMGEMCKFVHLDLDYSTLPFKPVHINYSWPSEERCRYSHLPSGPFNKENGEPLVSTSLPGDDKWLKKCNPKKDDQVGSFEGDSIIISSGQNLNGTPQPKAEVHLTVNKSIEPEAENDPLKVNWEYSDTFSVINEKKVQLVDLIIPHSSEVLQVRQDNLLITVGSLRIQEEKGPHVICNGYYKNSICCLGSECPFIHPVIFDPQTNTRFKRVGKCARYFTDESNHLRAEYNNISVYSATKQSSPDKSTDTPLPQNSSCQKRKKKHLTKETKPAPFFLRGYTPQGMPSKTEHQIMIPYSLENGNPTGQVTMIPSHVSPTPQQMPANVHYCAPSQNWIGNANAPGSSGSMQFFPASMRSPINAFSNQGIIQPQFVTSIPFGNSNTSVEAVPQMIPVESRQVVQSHPSACTYYTNNWSSNLVMQPSLQPFMIPVNFLNADQNTSNRDN